MLASRPSPRWTVETFIFVRTAKWSELVSVEVGIHCPNWFHCLPVSIQFLGWSPVGTQIVPFCLQPDGRILICWSHRTFYGFAYSNIARALPRLAPRVNLGGQSWEIPIAARQKLRPLDNAANPDRAKLWGLAGASEVRRVL